MPALKSKKANHITAAFYLHILRDICCILINSFILAVTSKLQRLSILYCSTTKTIETMRVKAELNMLNQDPPPLPQHSRTWSSENVNSQLLMLIIFTFSSSVYQHMCHAAAPMLRLRDDRRWEWLQLSGRSFLTGHESCTELDTNGEETKQGTKSLLQSQKPAVALLFQKHFRKVWNPLWKLVKAFVKKTAFKGQRNRC